MSDDEPTQAAADSEVSYDDWNSEYYSDAESEDLGLITIQLEFMGSVCIYMYNIQYIIPGYIAEAGGHNLLRGHTHQEIDDRFMTLGNLTRRLRKLN